MIIIAGNEKISINSNADPILFIMSENERLRLIHNLTAMRPKNKTRRYLMYTDDMTEQDRTEYLNLDKTRIIK